MRNTTPRVSSATQTLPAPTATARGPLRRESDADPLTSPERASMRASVWSSLLTTQSASPVERERNGGRSDRDRVDDPTGVRARIDARDRTRRGSWRPRRRARRRPLRSRRSSPGSSARTWPVSRSIRVTVWSSMLVTQTLSLVTATSLGDAPTASAATSLPPSSSPTPLATTATSPPPASRDAMTATATSGGSSRPDDWNPPAPVTDRHVRTRGGERRFEGPRARGHARESRARAACSSSAGSRPSSVDECLSPSR